MVKKNLKPKPHVHPLLSAFILGLSIVFAGSMVWVIAQQQQFNESSPSEMSNIQYTTTPTYVMPATDTPAPTFAPIDMDVNHWQIYQNTVIGVSFRYPANWRIVPAPTNTNIDSNTEITDHNIIGLASNSQSNTINEIDINYWNNPKQLSLTVYNQQFYNPAFPNNGVVWKNLQTARSITIGGKQGYFMPHSDDCDPFFCNRYIVSVNNKIFDMYQLLETDNPSISDIDAAKVFNQILSTFQFTN